MGGLTFFFEFQEFSSKETQKKNRFLDLMVTNCSSWPRKKQKSWQKFQWGLWMSYLDKSFRISSWGSSQISDIWWTVPTFCNLLPCFSWFTSVPDDLRSMWLLGVTVWQIPWRYLICEIEHNHQVCHLFVTICQLSDSQPDGCTANRLSCLPGGYLCSTWALRPYW